MITNAVLTAYTTFAFASKNDDNAKEQYSRVLNAVFYILSMICFVVAIFSREIVMLMTEESYHSSYNLVGPLLFSKLYFTLSSIFGYGFAYAKKSKNFIYPSFLAMIMNVILNLFFIPLYGALAAAMTTLFSFFIMMIVTYIMAQRVYPCKYDIVKITVMSLIMILIYTYFAEALLIVKFALVISIVIATSIIFRDTLKDLMKLVRQKLKKA